MPTLAKVVVVMLHASGEIFEPGLMIVHYQGAVPLNGALPPITAL